MEAPDQRSFAIGACLGRGGFGEVYRATMSTRSGLRREVAIKLLRADLQLGDDAVLRLRDEGRMLARLDHPALLVVYDLVHIDGRVALVTEFVDGEDLGECIRSGLPLRCLLQAIGAAADALHAAWTAPFGPGGGPLRLAHRDIKPSNLRISRHGTLKVLDFGIARSDEMTREARTATDLIVGSPAYMAPERFLDAEVRSASDVWALGCCLYEGTVGERLFGGVSAMVMSTMALSRDRYEAYLDDRPLPPSVPDAVADLVRACLAFDPAERPSAATLARRCEELADRVDGPTLRQWTRDREWPTGFVAHGPMDGRQVSEATIREVATSHAPAPRRGVAWMVAGGGAALAAVGVVLVAGGVGLAAWRLGWLSADATTGDVLPDEVGTVGLSPVGEAAPAGSPAPAPAGVVEPMSPAIPPDPAPVAERAPAPTRPAPSPRPVAAAAPPTGSVVLVGSFTDVALARGDEVRPLSTTATEVPVGTWTVRSTTPLVAPIAESVVEVTENAEIRLDCSRALGRCRER